MAYYYQAVVELINLGTGLEMMPESSLLREETGIRKTDFFHQSKKQKGFWIINQRWDFIEGLKNIHK